MQLCHHPKSSFTSCAWNAVNGMLHNENNARPDDSACDDRDADAVLWRLIARLLSRAKRRRAAICSFLARQMTHRCVMKRLKKKKEKQPAMRESFPSVLYTSRWLPLHPVVTHDDPHPSLFSFAVLGSDDVGVADVGLGVAWDALMQDLQLDIVEDWTRLLGLSNSSSR